MFGAIVGGKERAPIQQTHPPEVVSGSGMGPHLQSQQRLGNAELQQRMLTNPHVDECTEARMPTPVAPKGELRYYNDRHNDFLNRYRFCGINPPVYYMGYGDKYVRRFTLETHHRLSAKGQAWLDRARVLLQVSIEEERAADPAAFDRLERNDAAFTRFAYDTHPDAYWQAGLGDLDIFDLANIGLTPDARDLFGWDGIVQVADIGTRLGGVWGANAVDMIHGEGAAAMTVDGLMDAYSELGQSIDEVFGDGTAHILEQTAVQTGQDIVSIGQSLHGVAGDAANYAMEASDSVFGEGTTENAINDLGTVASDGADWVEERYRAAERWANEFADAWE